MLITAIPDVEMFNLEIWGGSGNCRTVELRAHRQCTGEGVESCEIVFPIVYSDTFVV